MDKITVADLQTYSVVGIDCWSKRNKQKVSATFEITFDSELAGQTDFLGHSIDYRNLNSSILSLLDQDHQCPGTLAKLIHDFIIAQCTPKNVHVILSLPKALLHANGIEVHYSSGASWIRISNLEINSVVGVNLCERIEPQRMQLEITCFGCLNYLEIARKIRKHAASARKGTIEALARLFCRIILQEYAEKATVTIIKPSAIPNATAMFTMTRDREWLGENQKNTDHIVYLALGSNIGDRAMNLETALQLLKTTPKEFYLTLIDTSFLYESEPMYFLDQPSFANAACKVQTNMDPVQLLEHLKTIESKMGRDHAGIRNGPRVIDIDILFYDDQVLNLSTKHGPLVIPHKLLDEREFVLKPLSDIAFNHVHPITRQTVKYMLELLYCRPAVDQAGENMNGTLDESKIARGTLHRLFPFKNGAIWRWSEGTRVMAVLNVTPDSFSDGGEFTEINAILDRVQVLINSGADIIDVGAQSTRPGAEEISVEQEIDRIVGPIQAIRHKYPSILISADTFRAEVAQAAIDAGADLINDVSAGTRDPEIIQIVAQNRVGYCAMHMRGDSKTMQDEIGTEKGAALVNRISIELSTSLQRVQGLIPKWRILVDPGIGFAKTSSQNLTILKNLSLFTRKHVLVDDMYIVNGIRNMPILVGTSRKRFLGEITGQEPKDRDKATAATVVAAIMGGANVVRVHNPSECKEAKKISDALVAAP